MQISVNKPAPDFTLLNQDNESVSLTDHKGKWVLIYFYPKDNTPGCTREACSMRDNWKAFDKLDAQVLGISADSVNSHKKFSDKYKLNFPLLADIDKKVVEKYGVWQKKKMMGREFMGIIRSSVLVNPEGNVAKIYDRVRAGIHADEVVEDLNTLSYKPK